MGSPSYFSAIFTKGSNFCLLSRAMKVVYGLCSAVGRRGVQRDVFRCIRTMLDVGRIVFRFLLSLFICKTDLFRCIRTTFGFTRTVLRRTRSALKRTTDYVQTYINLVQIYRTVFTCVRTVFRCIRTVFRCVSTVFRTNELPQTNTNQVQVFRCTCINYVQIYELCSNVYETSLVEHELRSNVYETSLVEHELRSNV